MDIIKGLLSTRECLKLEDLSDVLLDNICYVLKGHDREKGNLWSSSCCRCSLVTALSLRHTDNQLSNAGSLLVSPSQPSLEWKRELESSLFSAPSASCISNQIVSQFPIAQS